MASCPKNILLLLAMAHCVFAERDEEEDFAAVGGSRPLCKDLMADVTTLSKMSPTSKEWVGDWRCYNGGDVVYTCIGKDAAGVVCALSQNGNDLFSEAWFRITDAFEDIGRLLGGVLQQKPDPNERMQNGPSPAERDGALAKYGGDEEINALVNGGWDELNNFERDVVIAYLLADSKASEESGPEPSSETQVGEAIEGNESLAETKGLTAARVTKHSMEMEQEHKTVVQPREGEKTSWLEQILSNIARRHGREANQWGRSTWGADRAQVFARGRDNWAFKLLKFFGWKK